ncbi:hypothetical protein HN51_067604, partial [Arachis hypogaea]
AHPTKFYTPGKPFPLFHRLEGIFGKDRATGAGAVSGFDVQEQVQEEEKDHCPSLDDFGMSANVSFHERQGAGSHSDACAASGRHSGKKRKQNDILERMVNQVQFSTAEQGRNAQVLADAISEVNEKFMVGEKLEQLGFDNDEVVQVAVKFANNAQMEKFFVGCPNSKRPQILEPFEYRICKYIRYDNSKHENTFSVSKILPQTYVVELVHFNDIEEISEVGKENLEQICGLSLEECNGIRTLIVGNENGARDESTLPSLEKLLLNKLLLLNCVFQAPLHLGSLSKLKVLTLNNCPRLRTIFRNWAIQYLSELQKLEIHICMELEELIVTEIGEEVLPKLEVLLLDNLPRFLFICTNTILRRSSLEQVNVYRCPLLKFLPFCKDKETNLRSIRGEQGWWNELISRHKAQYQDIFLPSSELTF